MIDQNQSTDLAAQLAELIATLKQPSIPADKRLWDSDGCARYLCLSKQYFMESIACRPDFPAAIILPPATKRATRRWKMVEVVKWAESHRERKVAA